MKIQNRKVKISETIDLNEKDLLNYILTTLKDLTKNYAVALTEFSNENLYNLFKNDFLTLSQNQRATFELLFKYGWYTLESEKIPSVQKKYQLMNKEYLTLENGD